MWHHAKTAEPIEQPFGMVGRVNPSNRVLDACAYWRHLADTVEQLFVAGISSSTTGGGDASYSHITLGNPGLSIPALSMSMYCTVLYFSMFCIY